MEYQLTSSDFVEHLTSLRQPAPGEKQMSHPYLGDIHFYSHQMPNIQALELGIRVPGDSLIISDTDPCNEAINISFQLGGSMVTRFAGIQHPMNMKTGVHNLVYLSGENTGDRHVMEGNQNLSVFQVTIDKNYYAGCLESNSRWSEHAINSIEKNKPFSAAEQSLAITPRMLQLLQCLQGDKAPRPMKTLLFQSRLLELLALQTEQFTDHNIKEKQCLQPDDVHKLYALKQYLDHHFLSDLSLTQLSRVSCLNEFKLKKGFKSEFGDTVFGYVKKLRMQYAGNLLRDTAYTIDEVACELGYEYAHHFSKAFKDFMGCLPSAYRN